MEYHTLSFDDNTYMFLPTFVQALNRVSDSMGTLNHRTLLQYVEANDLPGLKVYLDSRPLPVDDRDEVCTVYDLFFYYKRFSLP